MEVIKILDRLLPYKYPPDYIDKINYIKNKIRATLFNNLNFNEVKLKDLGGVNGIEILGYNYKLDGYAFISGIYIKRDFSNADDCIKEFLDDWYANDVPEILQELKIFFEMGEKYGWD